MPIDLAQLCGEVSGELAAEAKARKLELIVSLEPSTGIVTGDVRRLRQAVEHVLRNAVHYTPEGGRIFFHASGDEDQATVIVSDNGPGIDAEAARADLRSLPPRDREGQPAGGLDRARPSAHPPLCRGAWRQCLAGVRSRARHHRLDPPAEDESMTITGTIPLRDAAATEAVGRALAPLLREGDVVALFGDLGAGKTSLARGVLAALGLADEAPSPTFAIVQPYAPPEVALPVAHVDLYRIDDPEDAEELGLDELLGGRRSARRMAGTAGRGAVARCAASGDRTRRTGGRRLTWEVPAAWEGRWPPR